MDIFQTYNVLHDGTRWVHLTLTLVKQRQQDGAESLQLTLDVDSQQLLTWTHTQPLDVKYLWMKSHSKSGYWRLHECKCVLSHNLVILRELIINTIYCTLI
jgi:hypothetical protein